MDLNKVECAGSSFSVFRDKLTPAMIDPSVFTSDAHVKILLEYSEKLYISKTFYDVVFKEERKLDVVTVLDVSNSMLIGTTPLLKNEYASVIASILSYSAILCGDKAGLIMMSNEVKKVIEPLLSTDNFFTIVRCLSDKENYGGVMDWALLNKMFSYLGPDTVVFIISDFILSLIHI